MPVFDKARHVMYTPSNGVYVGFGAISEFNRFSPFTDVGKNSTNDKGKNPAIQSKIEPLVLSD